jgi:hypothetical protein
MQSVLTGHLSFHSTFRYRTGHQSAAAAAAAAAAGLTLNVWWLAVVRASLDERTPLLVAQMSFRLCEGEREGGWQIVRI